MSYEPSAAAQSAGHYVTPRSGVTRGVSRYPETTYSSAELTGIAT